MVSHCETMRNHKMYVSNAAYFFHFLPIVYNFFIILFPIFFPFWKSGPIFFPFSKPIFYIFFTISIQPLIYRS